MTLICLLMLDIGCRK